MMKLNADFTRPAEVHEADQAWQSSPMPGVYRKPLDRIGHHLARATSIVRYDPQSVFSSHVHGGGEEFLVLDGVFQDENGDYPKGTYVRNPPQTQHSPRSEAGCTIFVKLWQCRADDKQHVVIDARGGMSPRFEDGDNMFIMPLYTDDEERVTLQTWRPETEIRLDALNGIELLVLSGLFTYQGREFSANSWLRLPPGKDFFARTSEHTTQVWVKQHHLSPTRIESELKRLESWKLANKAKQVDDDANRR